MQPATAESVAASPASRTGTTAAPEPELTLNLTPEDCSCADPDAAQPPQGAVAATAPTALEQGFSALAADQYVEAVQLFQEYRKEKDTATAKWESGIGIAYVSMLSNSPLYDADAARKSYRRLKKQLTPDMQPHQQSVLMAQGLESFVVMERHISDLEATVSTLKKDLQKREEAIKRLRELTLGQKGSGR